eukprot:6723817-Prymnesium_polylepis.1
MRASCDSVVSELLSCLQPKNPHPSTQSLSSARGPTCAILFEKRDCALPQRLETEVEPEEADADEQSHDYARLLGVSANHQNPSRQCQLAAHLERLPQEDEPATGPVVARQEGRRPAQRGCNAETERVAARPQQHC